MDSSCFPSGSRATFAASRPHSVAAALPAGAACDLFRWFHAGFSQGWESRGTRVSRNSSSEMGASPIIEGFARGEREAAGFRLAVDLVVLRVPCSSVVRKASEQAIFRPVERIARHAFSQALPFEGGDVLQVRKSPRFWSAGHSAGPRDRRQTRRGRRRASRRSRRASRRGRPPSRRRPPGSSLACSDQLCVLRGFGTQASSAFEGLC